MNYEEFTNDPKIEEVAQRVLTESEVSFDKDDLGLPFFDPDTQERYEIDLGQVEDVKESWDFNPSENELSEMERAMQEDESPSGDGPLRQSGEGTGRTVTWDVCAWYQAFHFYGPTDWGIYIKQDCVLSAPKEFIRWVPKRLRSTFDATSWFNQLATAAMFAYYLHEHYHHCVESLGFRLHVARGRSCYVPYKRNVYRVLKASAAGGALPASWTPDDQIEEALANANSYRRLSESTYKKRVSPAAMRAVRKCLKSQFRYDPPGYRNARNYLSKQDFQEGQNLLQALVLEGTMLPGGLFALNSKARTWSVAPGMMRGMFNLKRRFWGVVDKGGTRRFPKL